jgi:DNA polymerase-3 subunit delta'
MTAALIGQPRVEALLSRALARERVSHAYLFIGPDGVGKRTAARLLAQAINCAARPGALAPCGACESCLRIAAGTHPDVHEILPQSKGGQNISVEQMRDVRRDASLRPTMGRRKVYLLPDAQLMNLEAANTLLKTLEEPSEFVTLVLAAPAVESVLPTIQSRCQIVRFGLTGAGVIQEALESRFGLSAGEAEALARAAGGRVGVAFAWATDSGVLERRHWILTLLTETESHRQAARDQPGRAVVAFRLAETLRELVPSDSTAAGTRTALAAMLDLALAYYRDRLLLSVGAPASGADRTDPSDPDTFLRAIDTVLESQQFLERNVAPPLVLERMFACLIGDTRSA